MFKQFILICIYSLPAALMGCAGPTTAPATQPATKPFAAIVVSLELRKFLSERGVQILSNPTRLDVLTVYGDLFDDAGIMLAQKQGKPLPERRAPDLGWTGPYPIIGRRTDLDMNLARRVAETFRTDSTFALNWMSLCGFQPHVAFRVYSGSDTVDIVVCFTCRQLRVVRSAGQDTYLSRIGMFFESEPLLISLAKEALPDDKEVQALKPHENRR